MAEKFYLVLFQPARAPEAAAGKKLRGPKPHGHQPAGRAELKELQEELASTRESLQAIIEEQEAGNEELRSANEEIMSSNEELQSTNEELETAKEEMQSTNEELTTLNDELESRNNELERVNNDLHNLLASVNIPVIILGPDLRIRRVSSGAERLFNLIPGDEGRPITDINLALDLPDLPKLVGEVIETLSSKELEVQDRAGRWHSLRIRPYRTTDHKIDGAVLALVDIDLIKKSARQAAEARALTEALINTIRQPVLVLDNELIAQTANQIFYQTFEVKPEETLNHRVFQLGNGQWNIPRLRTLLEEILPENSSFDNFMVEHNFPQIGLKKMRLDARRFAVKGSDNQMILLSIEDITKTSGPPAASGKDESLKL
jgi:two-component system CheB/CheR fusion protein